MRSFSDSLYLSDIGNTNVKIWRDEGIEIYPLSKFQPTTIKDKIYFISVNREFSKRVKNLSNWIDISYLFQIETEYKTLGIDRVVAIYGCQNGIIVDVGSAVTIDIIQDKRHIGGYILLGKEATFQAFQKKAPHLKIEDREILPFEEIPLFSEDAIFSGFFHSIANFVISLQNRYSIKKTTITGGDGEKIYKLIDGAVLKKDLIFKNMVNRLSMGDVEIL